MEAAPRQQSHTSSSANSARVHLGLRKSLNGWQIFFITVSALIGTGTFSHDGLALSVAGPGALILATVLVGAVAINFMDGLSEMIQVFPCANALVEYVRAFVDEDLALCVGIAYWAVWSMSFSLQLGAAADFASAWSLKYSLFDFWLRFFLWFAFVPVVLCFINSVNVNLFGWIETLGGAAKLLLIIALSLALYYLAGKNSGLGEQASQSPSDATYLDDSFTGSADFDRPWANVFAVLTLVSFSWIGNEIVAATAFEAKKPSDLRFASQALPYVTLVVYFISAFGSSISVRYSNVSLSRVFGESGSGNNATDSSLESLSPINSSGSLIVIAANQVGEYSLAQAFNGFLIFSALSTANTSLYVASRTLYGLAFRDEHHTWWVNKKFAKIQHKSKIPRNAVWFSAVAFLWLPFISLRDENAATLEDLTQKNRSFTSGSQQWVNTAACQCALFVWGAECLAFIQYYYWMGKYRGIEKGTGANDTTAESGSTSSGQQGDQRAPKPSLATHYPQFSRWHSRCDLWTFLGPYQPVPAWFGLIGCAMLLLVFPLLFIAGNAPFTRPGASASVAFQVTETYVAPIILFTLWVGLKFFRSRRGKIRWLKPVSAPWADLAEVLEVFTTLSEEDPEAPASTIQASVPSAANTATSREHAD